MKGDSEIAGYPIYFALAIILGSIIGFMILFLITAKAIGFPSF